MSNIENITRAFNDFLSENGITMGENELTSLAENSVDIITKLESGINSDSFKYYKKVD